MATLQQSDFEETIYYPFNAAQLDLPGYTARFWTGVGPLTLLGETFTGAGQLASIGTVDGATDSISPVFQMGLSGLDAVLLDELQDYLVRGSLVSVWFGLLNRDTGISVADPDLIFQGRIDQAPIVFSDDDGTVSVDVSCTGALEWAMRRTIGRWIPAQQEGVWTGDKYCEFVDEGYLNFPWGDKDGVNPRARGGTSTNDGVGGSGSGGNRGGGGIFGGGGDPMNRR